MRKLLALCLLIPACDSPTGLTAEGAHGLWNVEYSEHLIVGVDTTDLMTFAGPIVGEAPRDDAGAELVPLEAPNAITGRYCRTPVGGERQCADIAVARGELRFGRLGISATFHGWTALALDTIRIQVPVRYQRGRLTYEVTLQGFEQRLIIVR